MAENVQVKLEDIADQGQAIELAVANEALRKEMAARMAIYDQIKEKELMLARAQEIAHLGNLTVEIGTGRVTLSRECARILGVDDLFAPDSSDVFRQFVWPGDRARVDDFFEQVMGGKPRQSIEFRVVAGDGTVRHVHGEAEMTPAREGCPPQLFCTIQDITDRHDMEESLVNGEALYRTVVDDQTELICRIGPEGNVTFGNRAFDNFFSPWDALRMNLADRLPARSRALLMQSLHSLTEQAPVSTLETRIELSPENLRWVRWTVRALCDSAGHITEYQCVGRDVTEEKAEEERRRHVSRMERLAIDISRQFVQLDHANVDREIEYALGQVGDFAGVERSYLFIFSPDGATMDKTHEWCAKGIPGTRDRLTGLATGQFPWWMGRLSMFNAVNIPRVEEMPAAAAREKELLKSLDVRSAIILPLKYRGELIGLLGFSAVRSERWWSDGDLMLMRIVGDTITGALMRKAADLQLMESDGLFHMLTRSIHTLIFVYAEDRFIYANEAAARFTGYGTEELLGMSFWDIVHPDMREETRRRGLTRPQGGAVPPEYRLKFLCKGGEQRWAHLYASSSRFKGETAIVISGIDVTSLNLA